MSIYRISPKNALIIEWQAGLPGARFCFYMVCDSPNEAKRILGVLSGFRRQQPLLVEVEV